MKCFNNIVLFELKFNYFLIYFFVNEAKPLTISLSFVALACDQGEHDSALVLLIWLGF